MGWIAGLLQLLLSLWRNRGPSTAEQLGAAKQALEQEKANEASEKAAQAAGDGVAPVLADPDKLRQYEAGDPNNRDRS